MRKLIALVCLFLACFYSSPSFATELPEGFHTHRFLLVIGTSRSGTTYITKVLSLCGLKVKHERLGDEGIVSWPMAFVDKTAPWGPGAEGIYFEHIFHQVRNPLDAIASIHTNEKIPSWQYIHKHLPQISAEDSKLVQSVKYWIYWNLEAEKRAEWTYRVEDIEIIFDEMAQRLGRPLDRSVLEKVSKRTNHWREIQTKLTWVSLKEELPEDLYELLRDTAVRYGYYPDV